MEAVRRIKTNCSQIIEPNMVFGKLKVIKILPKGKCMCRCECGNITTPMKNNLLRGLSRSCGSCGKNLYYDCNDGISVEVVSTNGFHFFIDKEDEERVKQFKWCVCTDQKGNQTVISTSRKTLHRMLLNDPIGYEVDHIDLDRLNNRKRNLRVCTHQQNQMNQPLQRNNTSGVSGVSFYPARNKYRGRIKISGKDIHLGYYDTIDEAIMARTAAMRLLFGEYGRYDYVGTIPLWIEQKVTDKCTPYLYLSECGIEVKPPYD